MLFKWLFPWRCLLCHAKSDVHRDLCTSCKAALPWLKANMLCRHCGLRLEETQANICGRCIKKRPHFQRCIGMWDYNEESTHFIHQLKFSGQLIYGRMMADLFADFLINEHGLEDLPEALIPVPLHWWRLWQRGFNQSAFMAQHLAKRLNLSVDYDLCRRIRHTQAQAELSGSDRRRNLKKAFWVKANQYKHVVIVDDVMTTMATSQELAKALIKSGIKRVDVWSMVRTQNHRS